MSRADLAEGRTRADLCAHPSARLGSQSRRRAQPCRTDGTPHRHVRFGNGREAFPLPSRKGAPRPETADKRVPSAPPVQGQPQGAPGQPQAAQAPAVQSSNQAPPPNQAPRDDLDELAEMAAAAESMLNEPPACDPADSPQEDRSSLPEDSAQAAEAVADDRPSGRNAQHGDFTIELSDAASHAQQPWRHALVPGRRRAARLRPRRPGLAGSGAG